MADVEGGEKRVSFWKERRTTRASKVDTEMRLRSHMLLPSSPIILNCVQHAVQCYLKFFGRYQKLICGIMFFFFCYAYWSRRVFFFTMSGAPNCAFTVNAVRGCGAECPTEGNKTSETESWYPKGDCVESSYSDLFYYLDTGSVACIILFGSWLSDRIGRRPVLFYGFCIQLLLIFIQRFSPNMSTVAVFVTLEYVISQTTRIVGLVLAMELVGSGMQAIIIFLAMTAECTVDLLYFAAEKLFDNWHTVTTIVLVFSVILAAAISLVPESPLWLFSANRLDKVKQTIASLYKWNDHHPMSLEPDQLSANIEKSWRIHRSAPRSTSQTIFSLFYYHCLRKIFCIYLLTYFVFGMDWALVWKDKYSSEILLSMRKWIYPCCKLIGAVTFVATQAFFGRKKIFIYGTMLLIGLLLMHSIILEQSIDLNDNILMLLTVITDSYILLNYQLYFMEYWPTSMRSKFLGLTIIAKQCGFYAMIRLMDFLDNAKWLSFTIVLIAFTFILLNLSTLPETKGYPLPVTLRDAEVMAVLQLLERG